MTTAPDAIQTYPVCGVDIAAASPTHAAETLVKRAATLAPFAVHLCNAYTLSLVGKDRDLWAALSQGDLNLPDGTPVAWLGRAYGVVRPVRGPTLLGDVARIGGASIRHYFYGGHPGVADRMAARLRSVNPHLQVAGAESPPYHDLNVDELEELALRIRRSAASIVWIGIGTPRQDILVHRLASKLEVPIVPIGAAFDFWSGDVAEAPAWLHGSGLEWIWRFAREPRRLWRRYLIGNLRFLINCWRYRRPRT